MTLEICRRCKLHELKNLRLGNTNEIIPTLEEVLELVDSKVAILIEIKDCKDYIELSEKLMKY
ncbi:MAG: hypothetical protein U0Z74_03775 [Romboutsia timonensis]